MTEAATVLLNNVSLLSQAFRIAMHFTNSLAREFGPGATLLDTNERREGRNTMPRNSNPNNGPTATPCKTRLFDHQYSLCARDRNVSSAAKVRNKSLVSVDAHRILSNRQVQRRPFCASPKRLMHVACAFACFKTAHPLVARSVRSCWMAWSHDATFY